MTTPTRAELTSPAQWDGDEERYTHNAEELARLVRPSPEGVSMTSTAQEPSREQRLAEIRVRVERFDDDDARYLLAEVERLEAALREIAELPKPGIAGIQDAPRIAQAALEG